MMQIGFIGLGHMGNPMVKRLLAAGFEVRIYDVNPSATQLLVLNGAKVASSLMDIAMHSDIIITMLQTGQQVRDVCLDENGLFKHAKKNLLYIDSSSIEIKITQELHDIAKQQGIAMIDAPVSGGVSGAQAGTLTFMVGGSEKSFIQAYPLLEKMGKKIVHAGEAGSGQAAKICNNLILGISMIAVSEGFALGKKLGLDPKKFFEISSHASGQCWSMTSYCPVPGLVEASPANHHYQPGFTTKMMLKDLHLAQQAAQQVGAVIPLGAEAAELYSLFLTQGNGEIDFSAIILMLSGESVD